MWKHTQSPYTEQIGPELTLRTPASKDDVNRIAEFNASIHGQEVGPFTRSLLMDYPEMEPADQVYVENEEGEILSALCLIPWTWRCEEALLRVGELGIVGTAESHRGRGLIRAQMGYFDRRLRERGCVLSSIQGIPYFYRRFGYQYALPLEGGYRLELRHVPPVPAAAYSVRRADSGDIPALISLYQETVQGLCFQTVRSPEVWQYLMTRDDPADAMVHETWIVEEQNQTENRGPGTALGYMRIPRFHFGDELVVNEAAVRQHAAGLALLAHAKSLAGERNRPGIRLNLPATSHLVRLALSHGAKALETYCWQIRIPEPAAFLRAMAPTLERRLSESPFSVWSGSVTWSLYTHAIALSFDRGILQDIDHIPRPDNPDISMPIEAFVPFVMGYQGLEELHRSYPDCSASGTPKLLAETLFPTYDSFLFTAY